jgi:pyruvate/2-oxoglutarate dehydrogenase complex dihydrolipoamide dehydrogenase (E3) component/uncharacterized membrane protein YdjX (TVP38/TMEM64 family)
MNKRKALVLIVILALLAAFYGLGLGRYFNLEALKGQQAALAGWVEQQPLVALGSYFLLYVAVTALSLPGAVIMTLAGGALFGLWTGLLVVSFASSLGATLAMLAARFLLRDWVRARLGDRLQALDAGIEKDGGFYLFALRLVPLFPFFVINLAMGLTRLPVRTFYWVSQLGMLAGTLVFVNVGTQLARIDSLRGVLSPGLLGSFVLLGVFPLLARRVVDRLQARKIYARWQRPARFNYNLVVIGAGSGGLVSAYIAAATQARVALVEQHRMGGDCLNTGCVPSKALIRSAKFMALLKRGAEFGVRDAHGVCDFAAVMTRVAATVREIEPHDSVARYTALGVDCVEGTARVVTPWEVEVTSASGNRRRLSTREIVIATGGRPFVPPLPGLEEAGYYTSDSIWDLRELPRRLLVLGGGPIGCELAQAFARCGAEVTQVEQQPRLLAREDPDISALLAQRFAAEGILVLTSCRALQGVQRDGERILVAEQQGQEIEIAFDAVLVAVGRVPNVAGFGLEELGVDVTPGKPLPVDEFLQTRFPNIHACGDVVGPYQFTHVSAHQAWYAAVNALFGRFRRFKADYRVIPRATFTEPEIARVGLNETEARERHLDFDVTTYGIDDLDRAIADGEAHGYVKVLTPPGSDRILGVTIVGEHAGDLLAEFVLAMKHGLGLGKILGTIHIYPTLAEANKYAAGAWKRAQVTRGQQRVLRAFQTWQRGAGSVGSVLASLPALWRDRRQAYHELD